MKNNDTFETAHWRPISEAPIQPFNQKEWFVSGPNVLLWQNYPMIGSYGYTKKGKGRWLVYGRVVNPTHWMPLPGKPA